MGFIRRHIADHRLSGEWFSDEILPDLERLALEDAEWYEGVAA